MKTPSKKAVRTSKGIMDKKSLTLVKKARKIGRKLRKIAIKQENNAALGSAEKAIDMFDKLLAAQKKLRDAETANEPKK